MPDKPAAEVAIDAPLVLHLIATQVEQSVPGAASLRLGSCAEGWDCEVWRLGSDLAVRLPRRAAAAPLITHEWQGLSSFGEAIERTGIRVPMPVVRGIPDSRFPWPWSVVPWIEGEPGLAVPRVERANWAPALAEALSALHSPAPRDHPTNPFRGGPLHTRHDAFAERMAVLRARAAIDAAALTALHSAWVDGLRSAPWAGDPRWIHGDLHPGNLVATGSELRAIIDFGDVTGGDPAYDLAIAWLAFDRRGRELFVGATEGAYDDPTWTRARAWAAAITAMLLVNSDDAPDYARLGLEAIRELADGA